MKANKKTNMNNSSKTSYNCNSNNNNASKNNTQKTNKASEASSNARNSFDFEQFFAQRKEAYALLFVLYSINACAIWSGQDVFSISRFLE